MASILSNRANQTPKPPKQYAPIGFGEPFNPNSVEGQQLKRQKAKYARLRREREAEEAEWDAQHAAEQARLAARSPLRRLWDRFTGS